MQSVTTNVTGAGYSDSAPTKSYTYFGSTPLVATETATATDSRLTTTTTYNRDTLGRVTSTAISGTDLQYGGQGPVNYTTASYSTFDQHDLPTVTQNNYGYTTTTAYNPFLAVPTSVTQVNGDQYTTTYDALGRTVQTLDVNKQLYAFASYALDSSQTVAGPAGFNGVASGSGIVGVSGLSLTSAYSVTNTKTVQPTVVAYYDRLNRVIRTIKTGFNGQQIVTDTAYNNLGQVIATSLPYLSGGTPLWTKTTYDALGRVSTVTAPNGTVTTNTYIGRATAVSVDAPNLGGVDPAAQVNTTVVDAKGRTVKVWNADNVPSFSDTLGTTPTSPSIGFTLDGFGRMRVTTLLGQSQTITATYDALGRQTQLVDPDKGTWNYLNSPLGQVEIQTDAKANSTVSTFDRLGRPLTRATSSGSSTETANFYYYDTADDSSRNLVARGTKGWIGAPEREDANTTGAFGYAGVSGFNAWATTNLHYYDNFGRPSLDLSLVDGQWFYTYTGYDAYSRVSLVSHYWRPSGHEAANDQPYVWQNFGYIYAYDTSSYLLSIRDNTNRLWWDQPTYDYLDRVTSVRKGAGHFTTRTYRATDGMLTGIATDNGIQNLSFNYDGLGNLTSRTVGSYTESFGYDNLNRLTGAGNSGTVGYLPNGNISGKNGVTGAASGTYTYNATHPHAVATAFGYAMGYDANGNLTSRANAGTGENWNLAWAGFDKPRWMAKTTGTTTVGSEFHYNAARSRVMQLEFDAMSGGVPSHYVRKRLYGLGSTLEVNYENLVAAPAAPFWTLNTVRIYIPGPDGIIGAREYNSNPPLTEKTFVYHYDHLGSIQAITNYGDAGTGLAADKAGEPGSYSEDAWGQRRNPGTFSGAPTTTDHGGSGSITPRGFTGHEMLDDLGLVHMNGRIYDPLLGRFLVTGRVKPAS